MSSKLNIKTGDTVMVMTGELGKDKKETGKVIKVFPDKQRIIVAGRRMMVRHVKPRQQGQEGGRIEKEGTIHVSNVMLVCPHCNQPTRVGHTFIEKGGKRVKVRVCKKKNCGKVID